MDCFIVQVDLATGIPTELGLMLIESYRYHAWRGNDTDSIIMFTSGDYGQGWVDMNMLMHNSNFPSLNTDIMISDGVTIIPVGSIDFCNEYLNRYGGGKYLQETNIPIPLRKRIYTKRKVYDVGISNSKIDKCFSKTEELFIKSGGRCKAIEAGVYKRDQLDTEVLKAKTNSLFVSQAVDFVAEWRVFVYRKKILDCRQYAGDWRLNTELDAAFIESCVEEYSKYEHSPAYTIDIGLLKQSETEKSKGMAVKGMAVKGMAVKGMAVIEINNFISCGLYGFNDARYILNMIRSAYKYELRTMEAVKSEK